MSLKISKHTIHHPSFIHYVVCLTTGPDPFPKQILRRMSDLALPLSVSINLFFPEGHPVGAYFFFVVFTSLLSFSLPLLQQRVLEGSSYARCDQSRQRSFCLLLVGCSTLDSW